MIFLFGLVSPQGTNQLTKKNFTIPIQFGKLLNCISTNFQKEFKMTKTVVVLNGIGTTSQSFGIFGGNLEQATKKFLGILREKIHDFDENNYSITKKTDKMTVVKIFADIDDEDGEIVEGEYWDVLNAVTVETECGGDPPETYVLKEYTVGEEEYQKTGAFND